MLDESSPSKGNIVLVHGGWHGGWVWERLVPILSTAGYRVHAPTLSGMGDREAEFHAQTGLETHVSDISRLMVELDLTKAILVGHSYGGVIITGAADQAPERISRLIYLDAVIPRHGVPGWEDFPPARQSAMLHGAQQYGGLRVPPPDPVIWGFLPGSREHEELRLRLTPHPVKTMMDGPQLGDHWRSVPHKNYLVASGPPPSRFEHYAERLAAEADWRTGYVSGGHEMMWTHPQELAATLLNIIEGRN